jgi:CBS domain-containing protein
MTTTVVTARPDTTFQQLVDLMFRHGVGGIPIVDDERRPIGIVTAADLITKEAYRSQHRLVLAAAPVIFRQENTWAAKARGGCACELMSAPVRVLRPDDPLGMAAARMVTTGVNRLPVVGDYGRLVGIVSRTDVLRLFHRTDDELAMDVRRVLDDPLVVPDGEAITATVDGGVVTLRGTVRLPSHARIVDASLWEQTGVVDIVDELRVENAPQLSGVAAGPS